MPIHAYIHFFSHMECMFSGELLADVVGVADTEGEGVGLPGIILGCSDTGADGNTDGASEGDMLGYIEGVSIGVNGAGSVSSDPCDIERKSGINPASLNRINSSSSCSRNSLT